MKAIRILGFVLTVHLFGTTYAFSQSISAEEPSMKETSDWIETNLPIFWLSKRVYSKHTIYYTVSEVTVKNCILTYQHGSGYAAGEFAVRYGAMIPLKEIDLKSVKVSDFIQPRVTFQAASGKPFRSTILATDSKKPLLPSAHTEQWEFTLNDSESAKRIARALTRAAILCGAKESPF